MTPLRQVFREIKRRNGDATTQVLTASGQYGMVDQLPFFNRSVAGRSLEDYYLLRKGEFAYNRSLMNGYPFGAIKRLDRYECGALSTLYLCFALDRSDCDSDFLLHFFESGQLNRQLRGIAQMGARAHGLLNVYPSKFFDMGMPIPNLPEQRRIAAVLNSADREIDLLRQQLAALKQQKKGLMHKLLTGEVRVRV
jgi:type I restriction enzyme S subunit